MNVVILDSYYPRFLDAAMPAISADAPDYEVLRARLLGLRFGTSDFYSRNLVALGHQAQDLIFNCEPLQREWLAENLPRSRPANSWLSRALSRLPLVAKRPDPLPVPLLEIALAQIRRIRPDVLYVQDLNLLPPEKIAALRDENAVGLVVGQIACPLPELRFMKAFDLILTSFPHYVDRFRAMGVASEYFRIGIDPIVVDELGPVERDLDCTFIGGISPAHSGRLHFLEQLATRTEIRFFGYGADALSPSSPILARHHGEVWGMEMYRALARSRITLNIHIDVAENYANNMRLYEATGSGALLLTDMKDNLNDLFKIDEEIITYRSLDEAVEKIRYFSAHPQEARKIALAGQRRAFASHTYLGRMTELVGILEHYLDRKRRK